MKKEIEDLKARLKWALEILNDPNGEADALEYLEYELSECLECANEIEKQSKEAVDALLMCRGYAIGMTGGDDSVTLNYIEKQIAKFENYESAVN